MSLSPHLHACACGQEDKPKPHDDEDLLVEYVLWQDAGDVQSIDAAGGTKLKEGAFGYPREGRHHRVVYPLVVVQQKVHHLQHIQ